MWRPRRCLLALLLVLLSATACLARDPDPYKLLDISRGAGDPEIKRAYRKLSLRFHPDKQQGKSAEEAEKAANKFMSIQKAYETLSDPEKRRNYDMTGFADPKDAWKEQPPGGRGGRPRRGTTPAGRGGWDSQASGGFPGGGASGRSGFNQPDPIASDTVDLNPNNFEKQVLRSNKPWLVQVYHDASELCQRASPVWEQTARSLEGIAKLGRVNIALHPKLAARVAPLHRFSSQPVAPMDLPVVVGFNKECTKFSCGRRYRGLMKESALSAYVLNRLSRFANVPEHTRESLPAFLDSEPNKVKFVVFSQRASRPAPLLRRAATEYSRDVAFALVHFKASDAPHWIRKFGVRAPPAVLVLKEDGKKIVEHDVSGTERLRALLIEHKLQILPQLRISSLKSTGCQPGGLVQVCIVVIGGDGWAMQDAKKALRDAKLSLVDNSSSKHKALTTALENKELAFVWLDAKTQKAYCRSLLFDEGGSDCGRPNMEPKVIAMRFRGGPDSMEYRVYDGALSSGALLDWASGIFAGLGHQLISVDDREAPNFPKLKPDEVGGALEYFQRLKVQAMGTAYDVGEELMFAFVETGPFLPVFTLLLLLFASTFFPSRGTKKPRKDAKRRNPADDDVMIEFNDEALRSLHEAKKDMVVMMFVDGMKTDQTVFKRLRASFWREPVLSFGTVNVARAAAWADFAEKIGGGPGTIVIWHPMRRKFQKIGGDGGAQVQHPVLCSMIEMILDGQAEWEDGDWPQS